MTTEEITKNIIDTVEAIEKLPSERQEEVEKMFELMTNCSSLVEKKEFDKAIEMGFLPLLLMLSFEYIQKFIAKNIPYDEALKMLTTSIFSAMGKKNHEN